MKKAVQYFSDQALKDSRSASPEDIIRFLEEFRNLQASVHSTKSRLISMKVPEDLLSVFKAKADLQNIPYQTQIKKLMRAWLEESKLPIKP